MAFLMEQDRQEWITLTAVLPGRRRRWATSFGSSAVVHLVLLTAICWPAVPLFLSPRLVAHGDGGHARGSSVELYVPKDLVAATQPKPSTLSLPIARQDKAAESRVKKTNALEVKDPSGSLEAGSPTGTSYAGLADGDEIKPALPAVFPDLKLRREELPDGVQGDVIVEVTIDALGNVVEWKLLQGLGHGIDERVIAVVRDWRFRPATRNGIPVPSKHDVHFHFPS